MAHHAPTNSTLAITFPTPFVPLFTCANTARLADPNGTPIVTSPFDYGPCLLEFKTSSSKPTWLIDLEYKPSADMVRVSGVKRYLLSAALAALRSRRACG